ncbi:hypothetical protein EDB87DRAFT_1711865 [Lactarius vividus]|nr:hypothetical protein EDB87DRAFT_1711865 [Lactarius vividus]
MFQMVSNSSVEHFWPATVMPVLHLGGRIQPTGGFTPQKKKKDSERSTHSLAQLLSQKDACSISNYIIYGLTITQTKGRFGSHANKCGRGQGNGKILSHYATILITHMAIMHISNNAWLLAGTIVVPGIICVIRVLWRCGSEHFCLDSPLACLKNNLLARSVKNLPPSSQEVARGVTRRDAIALVV